MGRRASLLAVAAVLALALGACGSTGEKADLTPAQEQARLAFVEAHDDWNDRELARLCPALYPRDFLTDEDKYPAAREDDARRPPAITAADREQAQAAGCDVFPG